MVDYDRLRDRKNGRPHVAIVGGGFGGIQAARVFRRRPVDVTLVDRRNYHLFQPLLYQVATAALAAPDIAAPIRKLFRHQQNVRVLMGEATGVDFEQRQLVLKDGRLSYDYLILAAGATDSYFGNDSWARHAPGLKSIDDAFEIRRRMLLAYEEAEREPDVALRRQHLTFVIVGGGPTGVELAGSMAEIARNTLTRNFRNFDPAESRVILIEGQSRVLPTYPEELSLRAARQLERLGVTVWTSTMVSDIDEAGITIGDERIVSRSVVWAAGVRAAAIAASLGADLDRGGRVLVEPDLSIADHPEVFVIGDAAAVPYQGGWVPGVAPAAMQMGRVAARNVLFSIDGQPTATFTYNDKGSLATIGRRAAVADFGRFRCSGLLAWLAWLFVHIFFLIDFRNRFAVLFDWAWAYFSYQRSARVILDEPRSAEPVECRSGPTPGNNVD